MNRWISGFLIIFLGFSFFGCSHLLKLTKPKIGVIIGAGGARSLSSIGVLKVLKEKNIPIDYLVGMGWGAWIASVYAKNESINEVQWSFHKLSKRGFFESSFFKNSFSPKSLDKMDQELKETFSEDVSLKIPFSCPVLTQNGRQIWKTQAFLMRTVKNCLGVPPFFKIDSRVSGSIFSIREAIQFLKSKKMDVIIWIHPLEEGELFPRGFKQNEVAFIWSEARNSFAKIEGYTMKVAPLLGKYYLHDFSKISLLISEGEKEGLKLVKNLQNKFPQLRL